MLLSKLEEKMRAEGIAQISVCTWSTNKAALALYRKKGFTPEKIVKDDRGPSIDTIHMSRRLT